MINLLKKTKSVFTFWKKETNRNFILQTILDLGVLFKNFFNWIISKIIISIYSLVIAFISVIPFVLIFFIYSFFSDVNISMLIEWMFNWKLLFNIIWNTLLLLILVSYFIIYSYSNILLFRLNNNYLDWKILEYKNEIYFDYNRLYKYIKLSLLNILILLVPILLFVVLMTGLFIISGSITNALEVVKTGLFNYFSLLSLLFWIVSVLWFAYLYYKIVFSFLLFSDDSIYKKELNVSFYIKESFKRTKWTLKFLKFSVLIVLFILLISPINYIWKVLDNNSKYLSDYSLYLSLDDSQKSTLAWNNSYYYEALEVEFNWKTISDLEKQTKINLFYIILFSIFNFIFIYWLFMMVFTSFYRKEII